MWASPLANPPIMWVESPLLNLPGNIWPAGRSRDAMRDTVVKIIKKANRRRGTCTPDATSLGTASEPVGTIPGLSATLQVDACFEVQPRRASKHRNNAGDYSAHHLEARPLMTTHQEALLEPFVGIPLDLSICKQNRSWKYVELKWLPERKQGSGIATSCVR